MAGSDDVSAPGDNRLPWSPAAPYSAVAYSAPPRWATEGRRADRRPSASCLFRSRCAGLLVSWSRRRSAGERTRSSWDLPRPAAPPGAGAIVVVDNQHRSLPSLSQPRQTADRKAAVRPCRSPGMPRRGGPRAGRPALPPGPASRAGTPPGCPYARSGSRARAAPRSCG